MADRGRGRSRGRATPGRGPPPPSVGRGALPPPSVGRGAPPPPSVDRGVPPPSVGRGAPPPPYSGGRGAPPQSSVAPPAVTALASELERKVVISPATSSKAIRPPKRPGYGQAGRKCVIRANHFLVEVVDKDLHHYDVTISPEVTSKKVCRQIISELVTANSASHLGNKTPAYDGRKSFYTAGPMPFTSNDFTVKLPDRNKKARVQQEREFKVTIKFAAKHDVHQLQEFLRGRLLDAPHEVIQVLDVVLRATPSETAVVVGRSFFSPTLGQKGELGNGVEYWKGFYQSLRPTQMGLSLNIDVAATAFYESILVSDFVVKYCNVRDRNRPLSDQDRIKIQRALKGLRVELIHRSDGKQHKIAALSRQPMNQLRFARDENSEQTTVVQYFQDRYDVTLKFPSLPALQAGNDSKPVYFPMEMSKIIAGQRYSKKLNENQVSALLKATCQRPLDREKSVTDIVAKNNYGDLNIVKEFGIRFQKGNTAIDARVLSPPMLQYFGTQEAPRVGAWNMIDKKMVNGAKVESWTGVCFASKWNANDIGMFCNDLGNMCRNKGMDFNPTPLIPCRVATPAQIERTLVEIHKQSEARLAGQAGKKLQLLIIVLPDATGSYGTIKRICETDLGIISQCCQPKKVTKANNKQYLENVSLKINVKTGGRNSVLQCAIQKKLPYITDMPTIIFGADVTHPQPGEDSSPSIAAVVASMDWPEITKYRALVSAQGHRDEIISDLYKATQDPIKGKVEGGMVRDLLIAYWKSTGLKPARIIFYRDGVSEGQFSQVLLHEVDAIRKACLSLQENYLPRITFVVVQKRHHTRLFAAVHGDRNSTDKSGNILPGTVVDTKICHPSEFDFYLCSHAGIQGTSRPTHYHVLHDENDFTADGMHMLTNYLCYTYARCTRSVSVVPPAYYAHLAAFRARYYIEGSSSETGSTNTGIARGTRERVSEVRELPTIKDNVKDVMFFC